MADAIILWTRVTPDADAPEAILEAIKVRWSIARDPELQDLVAEGVAGTDVSVDYTVKIDAGNLEPGTTYYYQFRALGWDSAIGRTRTLPRGRVDHLRIAFASCANLPYGYFNAYRLIAERADLDAVLHLGDYIYEYANGVYGDGTALGRVPEPNREIVSLDDYRQRHAQYKRDIDLQEAHRQHAFIVVWDDHESANDAWTNGAENHQPDTEGTWEARRVAALQAYYEWMPIREAARDNLDRIYRSFRFGNLVDLFMLDTRLLARDQQVADPCNAAALGDPTRQLLGPTQEAWLEKGLTASKSRKTVWRVLGQQVMLGQLLNVLVPGNCIFNADQWDGYPVARARLLDMLAQRGIDNVAVLTGDIHSSWGNEITRNPFDPAVYDAATSRGSVAVEFVTPGVSSPGIEDPAQAAGFAQLLAATHPHIKFVELNRRGYALLDITPERIQAEWYHVTTITERLAQESVAAVLACQTRTNRLLPGVVSAAKANPPVRAPAASSDA